MGARNSTPVKNGQMFKLTTQTVLYKESGDKASVKEKQDAHTYLSGPKFKKRATFDLNSNWIENQTIKIIIDKIHVTKALLITIYGTIKTIKDKTENMGLVKSVLEEVLPQYASQGEPMPRSAASYIINFDSSNTHVTFA